PSRLQSTGRYPPAARGRPWSGRTSRHKPVSRSIEPSELPHDFGLKSVYDFRAAQLNQLHGAFLSGLEAHRSARRNIEPESPDGAAIEFQCFIGLEKVVVGSHLNGAVTTVGHFQGDCLATDVDLDLAVFCFDLTWNHRYSLKHLHRRGADTLAKRGVPF